MPLFFIKKKVNFSLFNLITLTVSLRFHSRDSGLNVTHQVAAGGSHNSGYGIAVVSSQTRPEGTYTHTVQVRLEAIHHLQETMRL